MQEQKMTAENSTNLLNKTEVDHLVGKHEENTFQQQHEEEKIPQKINEQRVSTVTPRRTSRRLRTITTPVVKNESKTTAPLRWQNHNISAMLAWICKNKEDWLENRSKGVRYIHYHVIGKAHTVKAINFKIYSLQHIFESCFEFVSYIHNDQVSEPIRRVIRERAIKFEFYKECRAAFGPPEYDHNKFKQVRNIYGPPPPPSSSSSISSQSLQLSSSPSPHPEARQEQEQQQEQTGGQSPTPVEKAFKGPLASARPFVTITLPKPDYIINARQSTSKPQRLPFKGTTSTDLFTSSETQKQMDEDERVPMGEKHVLKERQQEPVVVQETIMDVDQRPKTDNNNNATIQHDSTTTTATIFKIRNEDDTKEDEVEDKNVAEEETLVQLAHKRMLDKTREQEQKLRAKEYLLMIQGIDIKMKRADLRFNKKKIRHEMLQAQRLQRINKYKKALRTLLDTSSHPF